MTQIFSFESDVSLEYTLGEGNREIIIVQPPTSETAALATNAGEYQPESLENYVARQLDFPSNAEFDEILCALRALEANGACPCPCSGRPDATRSGVRLRITVEVLETGTV